MSPRPSIGHRLIALWGVLAVLCVVPYRHAETSRCDSEQRFSAANGLHRAFVALTESGSHVPVAYKPDTGGPNWYLLRESGSDRAVGCLRVHGYAAKVDHAAFHPKPAWVGVVELRI